MGVWVGMNDSIPLEVRLSGRAGPKFGRVYIYIRNPVCMYIYIPGTQMTSILEGQPPKIKAFSNQNKGHLGSRYIQIFEGQPFFWWVGGHRLTTDDGWAPLNLTEATAISHPFFLGGGGWFRRGDSCHFSRSRPILLNWEIAFLNNRNFRNLTWHWGNTWILGLTILGWFPTKKKTYRNGFLRWSQWKSLNKIPKSWLGFWFFSIEIGL